MSTEGTHQVPDSPRRPDPRLMPPRKSVLTARPVGADRPADDAPAQSPARES